jgi:hypothetical protein
VKRENQCEIIFLAGVMKIGGEMAAASMALAAAAQHQRRRRMRKLKALSGETENT